LRSAWAWDEGGVSGLLGNRLLGGGGRTVRAKRQRAKGRPLQRPDEGRPLSGAADEPDGDVMRRRPAQGQAVRSGEERGHHHGDRDDDQSVPVWAPRKGFEAARQPRGTSHMRSLLPGDWLARRAPCSIRL
jgi:hypothetical protein